MNTDTNLQGPAFGAIKPSKALGLNEQKTGIKCPLNPASGHHLHRFPAPSTALSPHQPLRLKKLFS